MSDLKLGTVLKYNLKSKKILKIWKTIEMGSIAEEEPMHPLPPYPYDTNRPNQTNPGTMFMNSET